ncbi:hypothetical protein ACOZ4N_20065 [Halorientalis pallida]|uniref:hypothetical protein n=1 Tax=Halorientalis pallida TaxID=2479928 RepID=UPI003C6EDA95
MEPVDSVLFYSSGPAGPELLLPLFTLAFGLVFGYLFGRTDWPRWRDWLPGGEP